MSQLRRRSFPSLRQPTDGATWSISSQAYLFWKYLEETFINNVLFIDLMLHSPLKLLPKYLPPSIFLSLSLPSFPSFGLLPPWLFSFSPSPTSAHGLVQSDSSGRLCSLLHNYNETLLTRTLKRSPVTGPILAMVADVVSEARLPTCTGSPAVTFSVPWCFPSQLRTKVS